MKWSDAYIYTLKDNPTDAEIPSHQLMVRGGYIRKLSQGIYSYGPLTVRSLRKLENIIREELNKRHCIELLMPMVQPKELWDETGRWDKMGKGLLKFKNRLDQDYCLGATHEEVITDFVRKDIRSYRDLPKNLYQIQTKYRDEIRPRFGLMRGREFIMKDGYSFDTDVEASKSTYKLMFEAYNAIFSRLGVDFRVVRADSGDIGGEVSQEFHVLAENGEDQILVSEDGEFAANVEACPAIDVNPIDQSSHSLMDIEEFATPGLKTISELSEAIEIEEKYLIKTMFYSLAGENEEIKPVAVLLSGCDEVNPIKLRNALGIHHEPLMLNEEEVKNVTGASPGSCGPVGLNIPIFADQAIKNMRNYITGANKDDFHIKNVNHYESKDFKVKAFVDIRMAKEGHASPTGKGILKSFRGIEVGHIFQLGTVYTTPMGVTYLNKEGKAQPVFMGCYGLGVSRTLQATIEQNHDKDGIQWPVSIAPFHVHICLLDPKDESVTKEAMRIHDELEARGIECILDDRDERPGFKFKDADLLGMPLRLTVGGRGLGEGVIEMVERKGKVMQKVAVDQVVELASAWIKERLI